MNPREYFKKIEKRTGEEYELASTARRQAGDLSETPEIYIAKDMADKVEGLVEIPGLAGIIRDLAKKHETELEIAFELSKKVVAMEQDKEKAADKAVRAGLALLTQGTVAAPLEGIAKLRIKKNPDGSEYLSIYYAGPIRAAGGTAEALSVILGDYVRKTLGLSRYKPTPREIGRYYEEIQWYHRHVHLQYCPSEEEIKTIVANTPVCVDGEPTEEQEVANYRDLGRVETNRIRGGMCLVIGEGLAQKAPKLWKRMKNIQEKYSLDWSWLESLVKKEVKKETTDESANIHVPGLEDVTDVVGDDLADAFELLAADGDWGWQEEEEESEISKEGSKKYIQEVPAGRPVFCHPSKRGGFRLRYGRTRATGYAAVAINPATMHILNSFIAIGTQIRLERPGKAAIVTPCDTIDGPIVRLESGEVLQINTLKQAEKNKESVEKILHLGDILISAGDFIENNHQLVPGVYCEEWWAQELLEKTKSEKSIEDFVKPPFKTPSFEKAFELSKKYNIPLHPKHTFCWEALTLKQLHSLIKAVSKTKPTNKKIILENNEVIKNILETLGVYHKIKDKKINITEHATPLLASLNFSKDTLANVEKESPRAKSVLKIVNKLSGLRIKAKAPTLVGARMGRPEKAKPRKMRPAPHVMFPTGGRKGRIRNIVKIANSTGTSEPELARFKCFSCNSIGITPKCQKCGSKTKLVRTCPMCERTLPTSLCPICKTPTRAYSRRSINIKEILAKALEKTGVPTPKTLKGVLGMSSKDKIPEALEKGLLRAALDLYVFKDGTIRFDSTNAPLTHFKPCEIDVSVRKLREIGYEKDAHGKPLEKEDQLLELKPQDIIISDYEDDSAAKCFLNAAKFVDDLLEKYYNLKPFYNLKEKEDLVGKLVIGLAPHTSTGIIGRIIGFTKARVGYAHPTFHDSKRRDCDGDEDAIMLLLDSFLNFSRMFLPDRRGGKMDAPLVITTEIIPTEIDDEVYDFDIVPQYPLEFYRAAENRAAPNTVKLKTVEDMLHEKDPFSGWQFTHETSDINQGPLLNTYTKGEMLDKLWKQLSLAEKIVAVDETDVAEKILSSHFIPDMKGNLRTFSKQKVRCTKCNAKYRRPPLKGCCTKCGGNLTLTVHEGGIKKYLEVSKEIAKKYNVSNYLREQVDLLDKSILSIFGREEQRTLKGF